MAPAMSKTENQRDVACTKVLQSDSYKGPVNLQRAESAPCSLFYFIFKQRNLLTWGYRRESGFFPKILIVRSAGLYHSLSEFLWSVAENEAWELSVVAYVSLGQRSTEILVCICVCGMTI